MRIEIPPSCGWVVEFWWVLEQIEHPLYRWATKLAGDPDMIGYHWFDCFGSFVLKRRIAAERRRAG